MRPERCWPLAVGVSSGGPAPLVGVWVGRNCGTVGVVLGWSGLAGGVPVLVLCRGSAGRRLIASPRPRLPIGAAAAWCRATGSQSLLLQGFSPVPAPAAGAAHPQSRLPH